MKKLLAVFVVLCMIAFAGAAFGAGYPDTPTIETPATTDYPAPTTPTTPDTPSGGGAAPVTPDYTSTPDGGGAITPDDDSAELPIGIIEPVEELTIDLPEEVSGKAIEMVNRRKGVMTNMEHRDERVHLTFNIPSRGIIGLRSNLLTATAGEAVMSHRLKGFEPYAGEIEMRTNGSLIAMETGDSFAYAINKLQDRGRFFINPGDEVYAGQVIGESTRQDDIVINVCKSKKLTNMRASGSDEKTNIAPPILFSLEEALEYIKEDEYVEVTPKSMRLRKIYLDENERKRRSKTIE